MFESVGTELSDRTFKSVEELGWHSALPVPNARGKIRHLSEVRALDALTSVVLYSHKNQLFTGATRAPCALSCGSDIAFEG